MLNLILMTHTFKDVPEGMPILLTICKLNSVVCQDRVNVIGYDLNQISQKLRRDHFGLPWMQFDKGEL